MGNGAGGQVEDDRCAIGTRRGKAMGLVPNKGRSAPWGTTQVMLLTTLRATNPSSAKGSTSGHNAAK
jgi:hypothetical protein